MVSGFGGVSQRSGVIAGLEKRPRIASLIGISNHRSTFGFVPPRSRLGPADTHRSPTSAHCRGRVEAQRSGLIQRQRPATKA